MVRLQEKAQLQLPSDVSIEGFRPATLALKLEPIVEAVADVEVKFDGKLPDGYEIKGVTVTPLRVKLRGPSDRVTPLQKVVTESVSLDDRRASFDLPNVAVIVGDPKVEVVDTIVSVHVEIVQKNSAAYPLSQRAANSLIAHGLPFLRFIATRNLK